MKEIRLQPIEYRVVVLPDSVDEKLGSGVLIKAETTKTQDRRNQTQGMLVAISDCSFSEWDGSKPRPGDRVAYAEYSGQFYKEGEVEYKIMRDEDIIGILKEQV